MMWMILFLLLPLLGTAYALWHVWVLLPLSWPWRLVVVCAGALSVATLFAGFGGLYERLPLPAARTVYEVGTSSIIVLLYLVMLFLLCDLGRLVHLVPRSLLFSSWTGTATVAVAMVALFTYANLHYRHKYRQELSLTTEKPLGRSYRLVMASDLHLGYHNPRKELARWVDMLNAEKADAILIAGDIIDISVRPLLEENMAQELRRLNAPVYACLGNHEYYSGEPKAQQFYRDAGIRLLRDETALIDSAIVVAGRDDRTNRRRKALNAVLEGVDHSKYLIVLDHQPYNLEQAEQCGVDLQFSGHTHHGQVWPASWVTEAIYECAFGQHQRGTTHYYVSSGLGIWGGKFRIGTRSEYVVATIEQVGKSQN